MPKTTITGAYGLTIDELLERNRAIWGDARMEANAADSQDGDGGGSSAPPDGATPPADATVQELLAFLDENKLTPDQLKGRLEASKKWEARAKSNVPHDVHERVVAERDQLRGSEPPAQDDKAFQDALAQARDEGAQQQREQDFQAGAAAMLRVALRSHGVTADESLEQIVSATNLAHFKGDDGVPDDDKIAQHAKLWAATARNQEWPDTGQDRRLGKTPTRSGKELRTKYQV